MGFSSRWFKQASIAVASYNDVHYPVDLNGLLFQFETNIYNFYEKVGDTERSEQYRVDANNRYKAIVLWNENTSNGWTSICVPFSIERVAQSIYPLSVFSNFLSNRSSIPMM